MFQSFEFSSQAYRPLKNDEGDEKLEFSADKQRHCTQSRSWYRGAFFILLVVNIPALLALFLVAGRGRSVTMRLDGQSILENCGWKSAFWPHGSQDFVFLTKVQWNIMCRSFLSLIFDFKTRMRMAHGKVLYLVSSPSGKTRESKDLSSITAGRGFVEISSHQDPKSDSSTPGSGHYAISMFHQLHCLVISRVPSSLDFNKLTIFYTGEPSKRLQYVDTFVGARLS